MRAYQMPKRIFLTVLLSSERFSYTRRPPVYDAVFRCDKRAVKDDIRNRVRRDSIKLPDTVRYVCVDKYTVPGAHHNMIPAHLEIQARILRGGDFKLRVPMQGTTPIRKLSKLTMKETDGKTRVAVSYLLTKLMVQMD